ncbi:tetratricopeptide repeat protein [bacterium]|nr:tetratricopeptide repeat protein [bacterium]
MATRLLRAERIGTVAAVLASLLLAHWVSAGAVAPVEAKPAAAPARKAVAPVGRRPLDPRRAPDMLRGELPNTPDKPQEQLPAAYYGALAQTYLQYALWSKAEEAFRKAYDKEKRADHRADFACRLGQLHMRRKEYDKAQPLIEEAIKNAPKSTSRYQTRRYREALLALYERTKQVDKAEALYQQWVDGAAAGYARSAAIQALLRFWQRMGKLPAAIEVYENALKAKPDDPDTLEALRIIYTSIQPDPQRALALTEKLAAAKPNDRATTLALLSAYERARQHDKAIALAEKLMEGDSPEARYLSSRLVHLYVQAGKHDKALQFADEMLAKGPKTGDLHARVAGVYQQLGQIDKALEQYEAAAKLAPNATSRDRYLLSAVYAARRARKYDAAERIIKQLIKSSSRSTAAQAKRLLHQVYEEQNKRDNPAPAPKAP